MVIISLTGFITAFQRNFNIFNFLLFLDAKHLYEPHQSVPILIYESLLANLYKLHSLVLLVTLWFGSAVGGAVV